MYNSEILMFKSLMARYYRGTYRRLLKKILAGNLLHIDETEVKLQIGKGYVWVFTNLEEVVFMYRPTREGDFLRELLKDFHGVLVSDFYAAYDSIECPQQKCLIHLMRDINQELLNNPYDDELQSITRPFGALLRAVIETDDGHGLKKRHLETHKQEVEGFFKGLNEKIFRSEAAESMRSRLMKYRTSYVPSSTMKACPGTTIMLSTPSGSSSITGRGIVEIEGRRSERLFVTSKYLPDLAIQGSEFLEAPRFRAA